MSMTVKIQELIEVLQEPKSEAQEQAIDLLISVGEDAVVPLLAEVEQNKGRQSWLALKILACINDDRIIPSLILILPQVDSGLQGMIIEILGKSRDERAVPVLIQYLMVENAFIQMASVQALRNIGSFVAVNPLLRVMAETQSPSVRYTIIETLGDLGDPCAIEPILAYQDDDNHHVRKRVERALAKLTLDFEAKR